MVVEKTRRSERVFSFRVEDLCVCSARDSDQGSMWQNSVCLAAFPFQPVRQLHLLEFRVYGLLHGCDALRDDDDEISSRKGGRNGRRHDGDCAAAIVRRRVEFERLEVRPSGSLEIEKEGGASLAGTASIRGVLMERPEHSNWHNRHKN